ncbi:hypothetical protein B0T26DRAFT_680322 [Lasiosphaeria miniovina]|uniref:Uncharacterized protein n=1 Tax=Lasiosphaeria miniovina TaxID=1954250 RepID=A0AA40DK67_9PEZI|nr:uncharacterized protein B0T26DRAFT_680322 [Lasiosphaeria miniovina]KAK0706669.1 hypothetical protein B0T26DRAFT_680322 [Lasiosphaeria miniovina]
MAYWYICRCDESHGSRGSSRIREMRRDTGREECRHTTLAQSSDDAHQLLITTRHLPDFLLHRSRCALVDPARKRQRQPNLAIPLVWGGISRQKGNQSKRDQSLAAVGNVQQRDVLGHGIWSRERLVTDKAARLTRRFPTNAYSILKHQRLLRTIADDRQGSTGPSCGSGTIYKSARGRPLAWQTSWFTTRPSQVTDSSVKGESWRVVKPNGDAEVEGCIRDFGLDVAPASSAVGLSYPPMPADDLLIADLGYPTREGRQSTEC